MGEWSNWSGTERVTPARSEAPTVEELPQVIQRAARDGLRVKAVGSGHSFTGAAVAEGVQIRPDNMQGVRAIDADTGLVTVEAGIPLHRLTQVLDSHGLALEMMGDIDQQTLAGACATGTHGSGVGFRSISNQIRAMELVLADGSVVSCSRDGRPDLFDAARVSIGALGVVTAITLQCVPRFAIHATDTKTPIDEIIGSLDTLVTANDHVEAFWFPHAETATLRRYDRLPDTIELKPISRLAQSFDERVVNDIVAERMMRLGARFPSLVPRFTRLMAELFVRTDVTDLSAKVFASPRNIRFREGEYAVPRESAAEVLRELKAMVRGHDDPVSFPFEIRFVRADDIWLSPAFERDVCYIAFHQYHRMSHEPFFSRCEDILGAAGGRPHWGKMHRLTADELALRYPRFGDFLAVRRELDPTGLFANPYLDRVLGPASLAS